MKHVLFLLHKFGDEPPTFHNLRPSDTNLSRLVVCQTKAGVIIHNLHLCVAHHCSTWTWFHWEWSLCKCQTHSKHWTSFCHSITLQTQKKQNPTHNNYFLHFANIKNYDNTIYIPCILSLGIIPLNLVCQWSFKG